MSTKMENTKTKEDANKNDWDLSDDDNWDDWGDAEDGSSDVAGEQQQMDQKKSAKTQENNNVQRVDIQNIKRAMESPQEIVNTEAGSGWGSLFGGVVSSVLSTATGLTSTVTQSLDKVIGVPDPEEMARINAFVEATIKAQQQQQIDNLREEKNIKTEKAEDGSLTPTNPEAASQVFGLHLVNNVTSLGTKVLNTGLDTLEGIGKKTMHILQDNDPLLKNRIKNFGLEKEKVNLTEILKEAKKETEEMEKSMRELNIEKMKAQLRFEFLFENNCGLVHLEALEILSKESELKIKTLKESVSGKALEELLETLNEVKELMELEDLESDPDSEDYSAEELDEKLKAAIEDAELQINFNEIRDLWSSTLIWLQSDESIHPESQTLFAKAVTTLAQTCALEILKLHKIAELLLIKEHHSTANEVDGIVQLCKQFNMHLQVVANKFAECLTKHPEQEDSKTHINTIFGELLQARQQIEKAFNLFLAILQIGAM